MCDDAYSTVHALKITNKIYVSDVPMLEFEEEPWLGPQDCQEILLYWFSLVQRDLKLAKDVS